MKKSIFLSLSVIMLTVLIFSSCQKEQVDAVADTQQQVTDDSKYYTPNLTDFVTDRSGYWTEIPAGSVDALNQAIAEADEGGVIYLKAGMHTETDRVTINKRVKIIGEDGAVLRIGSSDTVASLNPALNIYNAPGTAIQNIEIEPHGDGAVTAILFENSPQSAVLKCKISGFPMGICIEKSDMVAVIGNSLLGDLTNNGILVVNGKSAYIADNVLDGFDINIFACDKWGTAERNTSSNSYAGLLLCNYGFWIGATTPNSTDVIGALSPAVGWKLRNNKFINNLEFGLSVRDGSNLNFVESNNEYSNNVVYDIRIPADEDINIPGVLILFIPAAYKNTIHAAPGVKIKDCGIDNVINGGTLIDTTQDPC